MFVGGGEFRLLLICHFYLLSPWFFKELINLFCLHWVFVAALGLSLVAACGACSLVPGCGLLIAVAPLAMGHGPGVLELRLTICGTWVWLPHSM